MLRQKHTEEKTNKPVWWKGRHKALKTPRLVRAGSNPASGTKLLSIATIA
jgi:hypothetical protein